MFQEYHKILFSLPEEDFKMVLDLLKRKKKSSREALSPPLDSAWFNKSVDFIKCYYKDVYFLYHNNLELENHKGDFFYDLDRLVGVFKSLNKKSYVKNFINKLPKMSLRYADSKDLVFENEEYVQLLAFNILFAPISQDNPFGLSLAQDLALKNNLKKDLCGFSVLDLLSSKITNENMPHGFSVEMDRL